MISRDEAIALLSRGKPIWVRGNKEDLYYIKKKGYVLARLNEFIPIKIGQKIRCTGKANAICSRCLMPEITDLGILTVDNHCMNWDLWRLAFNEDDYKEN